MFKSVANWFALSAAISAKWAEFAEAAGGGDGGLRLPPPPPPPPPRIYQLKQLSEHFIPLFRKVKPPHVRDTNGRKPN
jgi:hypothetical protein